MHTLHRFEYARCCIAEFRVETNDCGQDEIVLYTKGFFNGRGVNPVAARDDAIRRMQEYCNWLSEIRFGDDADPRAG